MVATSHALQLAALYHIHTHRNRNSSVNMVYIFVLIISPSDKKKINESLYKTDFAYNNTGHNSINKQIVTCIKAGHDSAHLNCSLSIFAWPDPAFSVNFSTNRQYIQIII